MRRAFIEPTHEGKPISLRALSRQSGIAVETLRYRIRAGWANEHLTLRPKIEHVAPAVREISKEAKLLCDADALMDREVQARGAAREARRQTERDKRARIAAEIRLLLQPGVTS